MTNCAQRACLFCNAHLLPHGQDDHCYESRKADDMLFLMCRSCLIAFSNVMLSLHRASSIQLQAMHCRQDGKMHVLHHTHNTIHKPKKATWPKPIYTSQSKTRSKSKRWDDGHERYKTNAEGRRETQAHTHTHPVVHSYILYICTLS